MHANPFKKPASSDQPEPSTSKHSLGRPTTSSSSSGKKRDKAGEKRKAKSALGEIMEVRVWLCINVFVCDHVMAGSHINVVVEDISILKTLN